MPQDADAAFAAVRQVQGRGLLQQGVSGAPLPQHAHAARCARARACALTRSSVPRPAPCHQTAAWKAGHKRECAQGQGAATAALIRRAAREAARPAPQKPGLTKEQRRLATRLDELQEAADWRGIAALEREALALTRDVRGASPSMAGANHRTLGIVYQSLGDFSRAIEHHTQDLSPTLQDSSDPEFNLPG